ASNGFGYRADDHGDDFASASGLTFDGAAWSATGIIEQTTDRDAFRVDMGGGPVTVRADPAAVGPNLDATLSLYDGAGNLIASAAPNNPDRGQLGAELTATVASGTCYVVVGSHGDYGDVGQYTVSVTAPPTQTVNRADTITVLTADVSPTL